LYKAEKIVKQNPEKEQKLLAGSTHEVSTAATELFLRNIEDSQNSGIRGKTETI
jgi:hypothetical protein